ncbi:MAG: hypothetical protein ACI89L_000714 [Phycisphaerales bacterium]|jgi:hypothetical protein
MNTLLNKLFGLGDLGFGTPGVRFGFERPIPLWGWAIVALAAGLAGWWSYRRLGGTKLGRAGLVLVRALVLVLIVGLLSGPRLERPNTRIENDRVVILLDRSGSMAVRDESRGRTRDEALREVAAALDTSLSAAREPKERIWLGFDATAYELGSYEGPSLGEADGRRTSLNAAVSGALRASAGRPLSAVVLVTDGRTTDPVSAESRARLLEEQVPVFAVAMGSPTPPTDLAITRIDAPTVAFTGDRVPVRARVSVSGGEDADAMIDATRVELIDLQTGEVLASQPLESGEAVIAESGRGEPPGAGRRAVSVVLLANTTAAGDRRWAVRLSRAGEDLEPGNDERDLTIALTDRPIRVLQIDGYPRWEFRYVRGLLLREATMQSVSLMLSPNRRFIQEGEIRLDSLPTTAAEWADFDVIIIGDVRPELFGAASLESLREHIAERGAGLIWMAGPDVPIGSWGRTAIGDLLPIATGKLGDGGLPAWDREVILARTDEAGRRGLLALADDGLSWPSQLLDPATGWSRLRWAQRIDPSLVKPGAEVLASVVPIDLAVLDRSEMLASGTPALLLMRYGAGRTLYTATEETWRWRYGRGEDLQERFWLPLVRQLARGRVERVGQLALLRATPDEAAVGSSVRVSLELVDQSLIDSAPGTVEVEIGQPGSGDTLDNASRLVLTPTGTDRRRYAAVWSPPEAGRWVARPIGAALSGLGLDAKIEARWPSDERREPAADHESLAQLAEQTGGALLRPEEISTLADRLPNRRLVLDAAPDLRTLWDRPFWFGLLLLLLTTEWIGRKLLRLV